MSVWGGFSVHGRIPLVGTVGSFDRHMCHVIIGNHNLPVIYNVHNGHPSCILQKTTGHYIEPNLLLYIKTTNRWQGWNGRYRAQIWIQSKIFGVSWKSIYLSALCIREIRWSCFFILSEICNWLPDSYFKNLVASMLKRVVLVCSNRGGSIKYWI